MPILVLLSQNAQSDEKVILSRCTSSNPGSLDCESGILPTELPRSTPLCRILALSHFYFYLFSSSSVISSILTVSSLIKSTFRYLIISLSINVKYIRCSLYQFSYLSSVFQHIHPPCACPVFPNCSANYFLIVSPFARLCRLTLFFFPAGFSFWMVCLVCITTSRWSESSETDGKAITLQTLQYIP